MKTYVKKILLVAFFASAFLSSCGKYTDGPSFSLRTKQARLCQTWDVKSIGSEVLNGYYHVNFEFSKNGTFVVTDISTEPGWEYEDGYAGTWQFNNDKEEIQIIIDSEVTNAKIDRLTDKELWLEIDGDQFKMEALK